MYLLALLVIAAPTSDLVLQTGHTTSVLSLQTSSSGRLMASGDLSNDVVISDLSNGHIVRVSRLLSQPFSLAFSPDDRVLAVAREGSVQLVDVQTGKVLKEIGASWGVTRQLTFDASGRWLVGAGGGGVWAIDTKAGAIAWSKLADKRTLIPAIAISRDGVVAVGDPLRKYLKLADGSEIGSLALPADAETEHVQFSNDDRTVAVVYNPKKGFEATSIVKVFDRATSAENASFSLGIAGTNPRKAASLRFSPDSQTLLVLAGGFNAGIKGRFISIDSA